MIKQKISLRLDTFMVDLYRNLAKTKGVTEAEIYRIALQDWINDNKEDIKSEEMQMFLQFINMESARRRTKLHMRRGMFLSNVCKRLNIMLRDGINKKKFEEVMHAWKFEAEANGVDEVTFYEYILQELQKKAGGGINETQNDT